MEKPRIEEISSKEYESGRVDRFVIQNESDIHNQIISFLRLIGVSEENLESFDFVTIDAEGYFFVAEGNSKIHLLVSDEVLNLILDTNIPKEEIMSKIEKYFQIF